MKGKESSLVACPLIQPKTDWFRKLLVSYDGPPPNSERLKLLASVLRPENLLKRHEITGRALAARSPRGAPRPFHSGPAIASGICWLCAKANALVVRDIAATLDLPSTPDSTFDRQQVVLPLPIASLLIGCNHAGPTWLTSPRNTVQQLGQLIQAGFPQPVAGVHRARILWALELESLFGKRDGLPASAAFGIDDRRAELERSEGVPRNAHDVSPVNDWPF